MHTRPHPSVRLAVSALTAILLVLGAAPALAHVTVNPSEVPAGFTRVTFRVPHGCEGGAATETLRIEIPPGVASVKPEFLPEWEVSTTTGPLPRPVERHGETLTEGVTEVAFTGPPIPDDQFKEFGLSVFVDAQPGEVVHFRAIQECVDGNQIAWIQVPAEGQDPDELDEPAPALTILASSGHAGAEAADQPVGERLLSAVNLSPATAAAVALLLGLLALLFGLLGFVRGARR